MEKTQYHQWQQDVIEEHGELEKKIAKTKFILRVSKPSGLDKKDCTLLETQLEAMWLYSNILAARIKRFSRAEDSKIYIQQLKDEGY